MTMQPEELKNARRGAGMSQAQLGEAIGMARETIGAMERGAAPIELRTELAVRFVTEGNFVGLRDRTTIHRQISNMLLDSINRLNAGPDEQEELDQALLEWNAGNYGKAGQFLLICAHAIVGELPRGLGALLTAHSIFSELERTRLAWEAIA